MSTSPEVSYTNQDRQYHFADQYDLADPETARMSYMRLMHEHTKSQFEMATSSAARRRVSPPEHHVPSKPRQESSASSNASQ